MKQFLKQTRPLVWVLCALLAAFAYVLKFMLPGYGFSALVCCGIIALLAFYEITRLLKVRSPKFMGRLRKVFTVCLCLGLVAAGITEGFIFEASLGDPREHVDFVVVLGAKVRVTGPSASLWDRIYGAYDYLAAHPDAIAIVSGGQGDDEPMSEGQSMFDELVALGIEPERIWVEDQATSTWENLTLSLALIEEKTGQRPEKIGVVSSEYHLFRASLLVKELGLQFVGVPAKTSRPSQMINHFMREIAGVWHYLLLGGQYD